MIGGVTLNGQQIFSRSNARYRKIRTRDKNYHMN